MPISRMRRKFPKGAAERQCVTCGQVKPLDEFYKSNGGYSPSCKPCSRIHRKELYEANKDRQNA